MNFALFVGVSSVLRFVEMASECPGVTSGECCPLGILEVTRATLCLNGLPLTGLLARLSDREKSEYLLVLGVTRAKTF